MLYRLLTSFYPSALALVPPEKKASFASEIQQPVHKDPGSIVQPPFLLVENTRQATVKDYLVHHDPEYISAMISSEERLSKKCDVGVADGAGDEEQQDEWQMLEEFGLVDDNHVFTGLASSLSYMTGASLLAAELICSGQARIAVHWEGGRYVLFHAQQLTCSKTHIYLSI